MGFAFAATAGLVGLATMLALDPKDRVLGLRNVTHLPDRPSSPLDEAERILAARYAKGELTAEEYERMLIILRR